MKRGNFRIVLPLLAALFALLAGACSRTPDAQRIREAMAAMQKAVEAHQPRDFVEFVSADFTGNDGAVDREGLHNLLRAIVLRNEQIGVALGPVDIDVQGDRATAHVTATLTGGAGGLIPERGTIYSIQSGWKRDGRDWRVISAKWEQKL